jgi:anti-anti-sigma factor
MPEERTGMQDEIIHFEPHGKVVVAHVRNTPRLDQSNCDAFGSGLLQYIEVNTGAHLLVSLEGIQFITSSVLSELIQAMRLASKSGGSLRVCAVTEYVASVFEVTHLDKTFRLGGAVPDAAAQYNEDLATANA